eukprot:357283-Chlamydomonas_euryale.AAC.3
MGVYLCRLCPLRSRYNANVSWKSDAYSGTPAVSPRSGRRGLPRPASFSASQIASLMRVDACGGKQGGRMDLAACADQCTHRRSSHEHASMPTARKEWGGARCRSLACVQGGVVGMVDLLPIK